MQKIAPLVLRCACFGRPGRARCPQRAALGRTSSASPKLKTLNAQPLAAPKPGGGGSTLHAPRSTLHACWRGLLFLIFCVGVASVAWAQQEPVVWTGPSEAVKAGEHIGVWLNFLNTSAGETSHSFPTTLSAKLLSGGRSLDVALELRNPSDASTVSVQPGAFARREYTLTLPEGLVGTVLLEVPQLKTSRLVLEVRKPEQIEAAPPQESGKPFIARFLQESGDTRKRPYDPGQFLKEHFFGYEPFYFVAGTESPNSKFQISLRYQILNSQGPLAQEIPALKGLNVAYTQTSLWDWNAPSAPFLDSSYKPEALYLWQRVDRGHWADWFRLDLQGGLQHESNGKAGADSRSLNILYLRPTAIFGRDDTFQLTLSPRVWCYVGGLEDNPDLPDFRGYADLRTILGWQRGLQLSATGRLGDDGNRGSLQLDLSYPMMRLLSGSFSVYLYAQYFTGYGESLLLYNQRSHALRAGFALFR